MLDENGLAGILPGAETCCIGLLFSDALALVAASSRLNFLTALRQAGLSDGVALHLIGSGLVHSGRLDRMSFLTPSQEAFGAPSELRTVRWCGCR